MTTRTYNDLHADLTSWLEGVLKDDLEAERFATAIIEEEEPSNGEIHVEVKSRHSRSGNPVAARFDYYDDEQESE